MKAKKLFSRILNIFIVISMMLSVGMVGLSAEEPENGLYIVTSECPQGAIDYAQENLADFFVGYAEYSSDIKLGSPFVLSNNEPGACTLYYFPVIKNNEIIYTFRIYEAAPNEFAGILSPVLAQELTALMQKTSANNPARILVNNDNIVSIVAGDIDIISADPMEKEIDYNEILQTPALMSDEVQNCMEIIPYEPQSIAASAYATFPATYNLNTTIREKQGSEEWCMAYSLAFMLNYIKTTSAYNAKNIMRYFYPASSVSEAALVNKMLTPTQVMNYAGTQGVTLTEKRNQLGNLQVYVSDIKTCIANEKPVLFECQNLSDLNSYHAIVAKGYTPTTFTVWNPRVDKYETISISSVLTYYASYNGVTYEVCGYIA